MSVQTTTDPFTMVEAALWWALDSHPVLGAMVKVQNRVKLFEDDPNPAKDALATADLPELALMPSSTAINQRNSSGGTGFNQRYTVIISTGDMRTAGGIGKRKALNQVKWAVYRALAILRRKGITDLPFNVPSVVVSDATHRIDAAGQNNDQPRAPDGWTSVANIEVWMDFPWDEVVT